MEQSVDVEQISPLVRQLLGIETPSRADLKKERDKRAVVKPRPIFEVNLKELKELVDAAKPILGDERHAALWSIVYEMFKALPKKHHSSEKSKNVMPPEEVGTDLMSGSPGEPAQTKAPTRRPNHKGRKQPKDYPFATHHPEVEQNLSAGDLSPCGCGGRLKNDDDGEKLVVLRFVGVTSRNGKNRTLRICKQNRTVCGA